MKDCQDMLNKVFEYIDNELEKPDMAELKNHLDLCRDCFDRVKFEKMLREHLKDKTTHICPSKVKSRIQNIIDSF